MKKILTLSLAAVLLISLCACGAQAEPEASQSPYADVIARLEAGDYNGARALIDIMEGRDVAAETEVPETQPPEIPVQVEITQPVAMPDSTVTVDLEIVELTRYNARDYFTFQENFIIADQSACTQYMALKEEYRERLIAVEDVELEVSYLRCEAHGQVDVKAGEFRSEYFEPMSRDEATLVVDGNGMGWLSRMLYFTKKGYFPDYAMDVEITAASGKLVFSVE